ncbi:hypothetical protein YC2023_044474 [Brassica napus]
MTMSRLAMLTTDSFYFSSCVGYTLHYPHVDMWNDSTYPKAREQMKKTASRNKPIKVRYISNPMRVKTCASKFRELVQELTGQDAVDLELEPEFSPSAVSDHSPSPPPPETFAPHIPHQEPFDDLVAGYYEPLDGEEMFLSQMSRGFSGYFSNEFYNVNDYLGRIDSL